MKKALIGYTGFVGATLDHELRPSHRYRSKNIDEIRGQAFDDVICAGVQAMKWWANLHPDEDWAGIKRLLDALAQVEAKRFTLISTIDVYPQPRMVDEDSVIDRAGHHAYGLHRLMVEDWILEHFPHVAILRLPGLFGPGLKKNVIYDMMHDNGLEKIHPEGSFQYYDTRLLPADIERCWQNHIGILNIATEPITTREIRDQFFKGKVLGGTGPAPAAYDMRSIHAALWDGCKGYLYSKMVMMNRLLAWLAK
jgi:nucleoside-diphosphate-sugar epimerase